MADPSNILGSMSFHLPAGSSGLIAGAFLGVMILAVIGFLFWKKKTYCHRAKVLENRNGQLIEFTLPYRYKTIRLANCVKFWGTKLYVEKPSQDYIQRINGRDVIYYRKGNDNLIYPVKMEVFDDNDKTIKQRISKTDADFWTSLRVRAEIDRWGRKTFLEQYGGIISIAIIAMVFIIGNWIIWNGIRDAVAPISQNAGAVAEASRELNRTNTILAAKLGIDLHDSAPTLAPVGGSPGTINILGGGK